MRRRDFIKTLAAASALGAFAPRAAGGEEGYGGIYEVPPFGDIRILHTCDTHAQLLPGHYREPNVNIGLGDARGKPPHLVGEAMLNYYGVPKESELAHAISYLGMEELAARYGKTGGFAQIASLTKKLRAEYGMEKTLHLDSGDMWQGSATALYSGGADMARAANILKVDAMTGHWEFTYPPEKLRENIKNFNGDFLAQNIFVKEDALFDGAEAFDEESGRAFMPRKTYSLGGRRVTVIGQAFPYTPIANPQRFIPEWTFGLRRAELTALVEKIREEEKPDAVVLLSHNGAGLDLRVARDVPGIDFFLGGHTHDIFVRPRMINGAAVINGGCGGKFVGVLDVAFGKNGARDFRYRLLPVFANQLPADAQMLAHIQQTRAPYEKELSEKLARAGETLYRRGNFNGAMDQIILNALRENYGAQIALSPGFRWGMTVLAGSDVRMEDVMNATAMTYPETYSRKMSGADLKNILEGVADNLYHPDPYYRQGGDMVRVGGMNYALEPSAKNGARVRDMRLDSGEAVRAEKQYTVAGWATQTLSEGPPVWEIVAAYLRKKQTAQVGKINLPVLKGVADGPGIADYPPQLLR